MSESRLLPLNEISETQINIVSEGTRIEGEITLDRLSKVNGVIAGQLKAKDGSTIILSQTSVVEGEVHADTLLVDGYVRGNIFARTKVVISATGRVIGAIQTPSLSIEFGAFFEGMCVMEKSSARIT